MKVKTRDFGEIEVSEDKIIHFEDGIPGFEEEKEFIILFDEDKDNPFHQLQSVNNQYLSFIIINPFEIFKDYDIEIPQTAVDKLQIENPEDVLIYSIVVVPEDIRKMTANLLGPIIINHKERLGKQVILEDSRYSTKHYIFAQNMQEEGK